MQGRVVQISSIKRLQGTQAVVKEMGISADSDTREAVPSQRALILSGGLSMKYGKMEVLWQRSLFTTLPAGFCWWLQEPLELKWGP